MRLLSYLTAASAAALLSTVAPALAQNAAPAPAAPAAAAPAQPAAPASPATPAAPRAVPEKLKEWAKFCDPNQPPNNHTVCVVQRLAFNGNNTSGSLTLRLDATAKNSPVLAVAAVPVGIALIPGLKWQIDDQKPVTLPFWRCTPQACESEQILKPDFLARLRKGNTLTLTAKNVNNKDFTVAISLAGFSAAYDMENPPTYKEYAASIAQPAQK
ncbi:MAG TPA: invasion associated locus B family protein [Devosia sp.]|nr:invasion associated locus B family protein [Devosia sp.]